MFEKASWAAGKTPVEGVWSQPSLTKRQNGKEN